MVAMREASRRRNRGSIVACFLFSFFSSSKAFSVQSSSASSAGISSRITTATNSENEYSFFDEASIYVRAGSGGQGASTYKKAKKSQNGIPDGGSGGVGGNVVFHVDPSLNTLASFNHNNIIAPSGNADRLQSFRAETGLPGGRMYDNGRAGEDCVVRVPPGTVVSYEREREADTNAESGESEELSEASPQAQEYDLYEVGTLSLENPTLVVAKGGHGGEGTAVLKQRKKGAPRKGPQGGERHRIRLTLKIVADVALVGVPNAGKSTFLAAVTRAEPKIANYPFTTVVPNLGVWIPGTSSNQHENTSRGNDQAAGSMGLVLCDVPGLIAGAADGVGLGHAFLRHVERCRVILHLLDGTSDDPCRDYEMVNNEIRRYGTGSLATMPQVVVVNKIDTWEQQGPEEFSRRKAELEVELKGAMGHTRVLWVSAKERLNMDELMQRMASYVLKIKDADASR